LFFCNSPTGSCNGGWDLVPAGRALQSANVKYESCVPYRGSYNCARTSQCPTPPPGQFSYVQYPTVAELQQHIMQHGSVVTAFLVYSDFYNYWANPSS
jgi:hypothetical protein